MSAVTKLTGAAKFVARRPWLQAFVDRANEWQSRGYRQLGLKYAFPTLFKFWKRTSCGGLNGFWGILGVNGGTRSWGR